MVGIKTLSVEISILIHKSNIVNPQQQTLKMPRMPPGLEHVQPQPQFALCWWVA